MELQFMLKSCCRYLLLVAMPLICFPAELFAQPSSETELAQIKALFDKPDPITWLITGDSITHGALHTHGFRSYPEHFAERIRWEMRRVRDVVINTGISGDRVPGLAGDLEHRLLRFKPTVVSIMMGMNDATAGPEGRDAFRTGYLELIDRLRKESNALILLHTPNPITPVAGERRGDLPAYAQIIREVAEDRGVALCDQEKRWQEYIAARKTDINYLLNDGTIHPNGQGHVLFAHEMCKTLGIYDPDSNTGRLYLP